MHRSSLLASINLAIVGAALTGATAHAVETPSFTAVPAPVSDADKRDVLASPNVTVGGKRYPIAYRTLLRTGEKAGDGTFGQIMDQHGEPIVGEDGAPLISDSTDFSSILQENAKLYVVSHFETRPASAYVTEVTQREDGMLEAVATSPVDFSADGGLWVPCAGSVTPWGTHLGSEEYEPDAELIETVQDIALLDEYVKPMALYFGYDADAPEATMDGFREVFDPYRYGYITEISVDADGRGMGTKHYTMGRFAHELGYTLPDRKTVYLSDDGTNVGLYRFVADEADELDGGTLYAAKWRQTDGENGGAADLDWIDLGHADSASVRKLIDAGTSFSDIFERRDMAEDGSCAAGFGGSVANGVAECLKVKPGMELAASRLETRRYAALQGATVELRKEEGITYDPDHRKLYVAISEIAKGMEDEGRGKLATREEESPDYDLGGSNDIRLAKNKCGGVYELALDEDFVATSMRAMIVGTPTEYAEGDRFAGNTCDIDGLANPDNLSYLPGSDVLFIGEDTETGHQNDAVWSYDVNAGDLTRIETTPYGSETTSVYVYPNVQDHAYLMSIVQHPYGESDEDELKTPDQARAYLGYIGPMPVLD